MSEMLHRGHVKGGRVDHLWTPMEMSVWDAMLRHHNRVPGGQALCCAHPQTPLTAILTEPEKPLCANCSARKQIRASKAEQRDRQRLVEWNAEMEGATVRADPTDHRAYLKPLPAGVPPEELEPGFYAIGPPHGTVRILAVAELHDLEIGEQMKAMAELHRAVMRGKAERFQPPAEEAPDAATT